MVSRELPTSPQPLRRSLHPAAAALGLQRAPLALLVIPGQVKSFCFQTPLLKRFLRIANVSKMSKKAVTEK